MFWEFVKALIFFHIGIPIIIFLIILGIGAFFGLGGLITRFVVKNKETIGWIFIGVIFLSAIKYNMENSKYKGFWVENGKIPARVARCKSPSECNDMYPLGGTEVWVTHNGSYMESNKKFHYFILHLEDASSTASGLQKYYPRQIKAKGSCHEGRKGAPVGYYCIVKDDAGNIYAIYP